MIRDKYELIEAYEEMLRDAYGPVKIGTLEYDQAYVLKAVDPVAYRVGLLDYADSLAQDGELPEDWEEWDI